MSKEPEYIKLKLTPEQRKSRIIELPSDDVYDVAFILPDNPKAQKVPTAFWSVERNWLTIANSPPGYPDYDIPEEILVQCR